MKNERKKFRLASLLFMLNLVGCWFTVRFLFDAFGRGSSQYDLAVRMVPFLVVGMLAFLIVNVGTSLSYLRKSANLPDLQTRDKAYRELTRFFILLSVLLGLLYTVLLYLTLTNGE